MNRRNRQPQGHDEDYGRHSHAHAPGPTVAELLSHAVERGDALRLAWPDQHHLVEPGEEYPTAELPAIRTD